MSCAVKRRFRISRAWKRPSSFPGGCTCRPSMNTSTSRTCACNLRLHARRSGWLARRSRSRAAEARLRQSSGGQTSRDRERSLEAAGVELDWVFGIGPDREYPNRIDGAKTPDPLKNTVEPPNCPQPISSFLHAVAAKKRHGRYETAGDIERQDRVGSVRRRLCRRLHAKARWVVNQTRPPWTSARRSVVGSQTRSATGAGVSPPSCCRAHRHRARMMRARRARGPPSAIDARASSMAVVRHPSTPVKAFGRPGCRALIGCGRLHRTRVAGDRLG